MNIESWKNIIASEAAFWASWVYIVSPVPSQINILLNQIELLSFP